MKNGRIVIVDGYNALFKLARLQYGQNDFQLEVERNYFVSLLSERDEEEIIVFDGIGDDLQLIRKGHQWILFTRGRQTADELILALLNSAGAYIAARLIVDHHHRKVVVVTDDRELREKIHQTKPEVVLLHVSSLIKMASS